MRLVAVLLVMAAGGAAAATESIDPRLAKRLAVVLQSADEDAEGTLAQLGEMAQSWRRRPEQQAYVIVERAALLVQMDRLEIAREEIDAALAGKPPAFSPTLRLAFGRLLLIIDDVERAASALETWRAHALVPASQGLFLLGYAYTRLERYGEAVEVLEAAVADPDPRASWVELLAYAYARTGRGDDAVALLHGLIAGNPNHARWWRLLAMVYQLMDSNARGAAALAIVGEVDDLSLSETKYLASVLAHLGMPYDGAMLLDAALEGLDGEYQNRMLLARLWMFAREFDRAVSALGRAAEVAQDGEPGFLLGQLYLHWERYEEAVSALERAIGDYREQVPAEAFYLLAVAAANLERYGDARLALIRIEGDDKYTERARSLMRYLDNAERESNDP